MQQEGFNSEEQGQALSLYGPYTAQPGGPSTTGPETPHLGKGFRKKVDIP